MNLYEGKGMHARCTFLQAMEMDDLGLRLAVDLIGARRNFLVAINRYDNYGMWC